jgi:hypothetical protein
MVGYFHLEVEGSRCDSLSPFFPLDSEKTLKKALPVCPSFSSFLPFSFLFVQVRELIGLHEGNTNRGDTKKKGEEGRLSLLRLGRSTSSYLGIDQLQYFLRAFGFQLKWSNTCVSLFSVTNVREPRCLFFRC